MGTLDANLIPVTGFGSMTGAMMETAASDGATRSTTWANHLEHISTVANLDCPENGRHWRHRWEPTPNGGNGTDITEIRFMDCADTAARTVYLRDWVLFENPWAWGQSTNPWEWGGKMGGLMGGNPAVGGQNNTDGFSVRWDWSENGEAQLYLYHQDRSQNCSGGSPQSGSAPCYGDELKSTIQYPIGQWFCRELRVTANTGPNNFDGSVEFWIDGVQGNVLNGLRWQTSGPTPYQVDQYAYVMLFGGGNAWAPPQTQYSQFANIEWSTQRLGCNPEDAPDFCPVGCNGQLVTV